MGIEESLKNRQGSNQTCPLLTVKRDRETLEAIGAHGTFPADLERNRLGCILGCQCCLKLLNTFQHLLGSRLIIRHSCYSGAFKARQPNRVFLHSWQSTGRSVSTHALPLSRNQTIDLAFPCALTESKSSERMDSHGVLYFGPC